MKAFIIILSALALLFLTGGCMPLAIGGVALAAAVCVLFRRHLLNDPKIRKFVDDD